MNTQETLQTAASDKDNLPSAMHSYVIIRERKDINNDSSKSNQSTK
jgi:hypothetical protein